MAEAASGSKPERWRLFVAVELTDGLLRALEAPLRSLDSLDSLVRRSPSSGIHLTLAFLGMVEVFRVEAIRSALAAATADVRRFTVDVGGSGVFPSPSHPQVLWIGVGGEDRPRLVDLAAAIGAHLHQAGFELEPRPFHPHLTLGRLRSRPRRSDLPQLRAWLEEWRDRPLSRLDVTAVNLIRSELGKGPPVYTRLQSFGLE